MSHVVTQIYLTLKIKTDFVRSQLMMDLNSKYSIMMEGKCRTEFPHNSLRFKIKYPDHLLTPDTFLAAPPPPPPPAPPPELDFLVLAQSSSLSLSLPFFFLAVFPFLAGAFLPFFDGLYSSSLTSYQISQSLYKSKPHSIINKYCVL